MVNWDYCSCDDIGEGPCPVHGVAMAAQDRALATREDLVARPKGCQCHMEEGDSPCPVHGDGTLDAKALLAMVLELRTEIGTLHDKLNAQQAGHEVDRLFAARPALVILCRELGLPIHADPRDGIRDFVEAARRSSDGVRR